MMTTPLAVLLLCLALSPGISGDATGAGTVQTDFFLTEFGDRYDIDGATQFPLAKTGAVVVHYDFQSSEIDPNTGEYLIPDYEFAYSLRPYVLTGNDLVQAGAVWVFGGPGLTPNEEVLDFDPVTGVGRGRVYLPLFLTTRSYAWGQPCLGDSEMKIYWGSGSQIEHDGIHPPESFVGTKSLSLSTYLEDLTLAFRENHAMVVGQPAELTIVLRQPAEADLMIELSSTDPMALSVPASVVVPAGQDRIQVQVIPQEPGKGWIDATVPSWSNQAFDSQKFEIVEASIIEAVSEVAASDGGDPDELPGEGLRRRCVHPEPSTPNSGPDPGIGNYQVVCGGCSSGTPSSPCDFPVGTYAGAWIRAHCVYNEFSSCHRGPYVDIETTAWKLVEKQIVKCEADDIYQAVIYFFTSPRYRWCCKFQRVVGSYKMRVPDCI